MSRKRATLQRATIEYLTIEYSIARGSPLRCSLEKNLSEKNRTNWAALAGARFILSVVVLMCLLSIVARGSVSDIFEQFNAFSAVIAFFLISGYSIRLSIARDQSGYFARRFWRIYPIYAASLLFAVALLLVIKPARFVNE